MAEQRRQYWIHDGGEYECPHATLVGTRVSASDKLVYLTEEEALRHTRIQSEWDKAQNELWTLYDS